MKKTMLAIALGMCAFSAQAAAPEPIKLDVQVTGEVPSQDVFEVKPVGWASGDPFDLNVPSSAEDWDKGPYVVLEKYWNIRSSYGAVYASVAGTKWSKDYYANYEMKSTSGNILPYYVTLSDASEAGVNSWSGWIRVGNSRRHAILAAPGAARGANTGFRIKIGAVGPYPPPGEYSATVSFVLETGID